METATQGHTALAVSHSRLPSLEAARVTDLRAGLLLATAMMCGAVMMGLELSASRLYAPYFGYSVYVWGSMISVIMAALAVGYALGGRFADKVCVRATLSYVILAGALAQLIALYAARSLLSALAGQGEFIGVAIGTVVLFAPSLIALAATGPMIVRLCATARHVGAAAGRVYAISTVGGIAGILLTTFGLLPRVGTHRTLQVWCAVNFAAAVINWVHRAGSPLLAFGVAFAILVAPGFGWSENTIWLAESPYNLVRVVRSGTQTTLLLNQQTSVHTIQQDSSPWTGYYYDTFAVGPLLVHTDRALVLGMGAGGCLRSIRAVDPAVRVDAVEIDPGVVDAAVRWFHMDPSDPRLRIHIADARPWLSQSHDVYDLVQVDLYQGGPYIPFYLVTREFFGLARTHMTSNAVLMMNVYDAGSKRELLASAAATLRSVFPSVMVLKGSSANYMLLGFVRPRSVDAVRSLLEDERLTPRLREIVRSTMPALSDYSSPDGAPVFTDDRAPVEDITRRMLADRRR